MRLRCIEETTVSMVSTPHSPPTAPRAPPSRPQTLPQTPPRSSRPMQQQASKFSMSSTERLEIKRNWYSHSHLQNKSDKVRLPRWRRKITITHTHLHVQTPCHDGLYTICYLYTHTSTYTKRGESSKFRCVFVSLMNLQGDSTESTFTYMYVINTTYHFVIMNNR